MMSELNNIAIGNCHKIASAITQYARAVEDFENASNAFNAACASVREVVVPNTRFIVDNRNTTMLLVTVDNDKSFTVEPIKVI